MPSRQAKLQEDTAFRLMRLLQDNPKMSQRELAQALGLSLGGVNYCLKALMDKGWMKMRNFQNNPHKREYAYLLTPKGLAQKAGLTARFLKRKMEEYEELKAEIEGLRQEIGNTPKRGSKA